jgi:hypothetical protein
MNRLKSNKTAVLWRQQQLPITVLLINNSLDTSVIGGYIDAKMVDREYTQKAVSQNFAALRPQRQIRRCLDGTLDTSVAVLGFPDWIKATARW